MISAVVLAAGLSSRMGQNKLLMKMGNQSIIEHVIEKVSKSSVSEIIVVLGNEAKEVEEKLKRFNIKKIINPRFAEGQSTSVQVGLHEVDTASDGVIFIMGDQPLISPDIINEIIKIYDASEKSIVVPTHQGKRGNPVLFGNHWFDELSRVSGDMGGRRIIQNNPSQLAYLEISDEQFFKDVDDENMYRQLKEVFDKLNENFK